MKKAKRAKPYRPRPVTSPVVKFYAHQRLLSGITHLSIGMYMTPHGEAARDQLALMGFYVGWGLAMASEIEFGSARMKQLHGTLRGIVQAAHAGARWDAALTPAIERSLHLAEKLLIDNARLALRMQPWAEGIELRIKNGTVQLSDVAGPEIYNASQPEGHAQDVAEEAAA